MLHAFDAGSPILTAKRDLDCNAPFDAGTGEERWAFIPPDMLPRLKDLLGDEHLYTVDGNVMSRDVWVDANLDRKKQKDEFHTVAIFSERAGGTQYIALDVTNIESPRMLWTFPPPGSVDAQWMGQSWSDFSPRPAPVGPVRLALSATDTLNKRDFEERWIAMLNGGYDPTLTSGNAVWMVDVWSGSVVWRFTDDDFKAQNGYGSSTSMYSIPAAVALMDIGDPAQPTFDGDGFFDTATSGRSRREHLRGPIPRARPDRPGHGQGDELVRRADLRTAAAEQRLAVRNRARSLLLHDGEYLRAPEPGSPRLRGKRKPGADSTSRERRAARTTCSAAAAAAAR